YTMCCRNGKVKLPQHYFTFPSAPPFLIGLLTEDTDRARKFRNNIRSYNNTLSFTSLGCKIDRSVDGPYGICCFKIFGQLVHNMGSILPRDNEAPAFAQIYLMGQDTDEEADHRVFMSQADIDPTIIKQFLDFFYVSNPYAIQFKMAYQVAQQYQSISFCIKSIPPPPPGQFSHDVRTYVRPSASEVAMIVGGGGDIGENNRDIILHSVDGGFKRVSKRHTGYLPLRYPVLFPWGQAGYDKNYRVPTDDGECRPLDLLPLYMLI
ncbi:uncharacterized protein MELLADRAFT_40611, partial [Melampsora larici-populina 98AG31]